MDSPTELADWVTSSFRCRTPTARRRRFRLVAHADAAQADVDELAKDRRAARARAARRCSASSPPTSPAHYTFLLDYVAWARRRRHGASQQHVDLDALVVSLKTPQGRRQALDDDLARVLPQLERRAHPAGRPRAVRLHAREHHVLPVAGRGIHAVLRAAADSRAPDSAQQSAVRRARSRSSTASGRQVRSAVEMSEHAPVRRRRRRPIDAHDRSRTFISYYTYGAAIALGARSVAARAVRRQALRSTTSCARSGCGTGQPADPRPGYVAKPYTLADLRAVLGDVPGNKTFAGTSSSTATSKDETPPTIRGCWRLRATR